MRLQRLSIRLIPCLLAWGILTSGGCVTPQTGTTPGESAARASRRPLSYAATNQDANSRTAPFLGSENAPITIVEFFSFECPYCVREVQKLRQILTEYPNDVKLVFKHFPLSFHIKGRKAAAVASLAYRDLGNAAFWKLHDKIVDGGIDHLDLATLRNYASEVGLDSITVDEILADHEARDALLGADLEEGKRLGVRGTPTVFINGVELVKRTMKNYRSRIESMLGPTGRDAAGHAASDGRDRRVEKGVTSRHDSLPVSMLRENQESGLVLISSDNTELEIYVDGLFVGNAPAKLQLDEGVHIIEGKGKGLEDFRREINVLGGAELVMRINPKPITPEPGR